MPCFSQPPGSTLWTVENGYFYAVDPLGRLKWTFRTSDFIEAAPATANDGSVYVGTAAGMFYAFQPNGVRKWFVNTRGISSSPAVSSNGTIYFGAYSANKLYALTATGSNLWTFATPSPVFSSPVIGADGTLYPGLGSKLYAIVDPTATAFSSRYYRLSVP